SRVAPELERSHAQEDLNAAVWSAGRYLAEYDRPLLEPAEALLLARFREAFSRRVLDVGCGAGRILGYLVALGAQAHGIDISPRMVEHCRRRFPGIDVRVGDLRALPATVQGSFDVVLLSDNVLDVLDDLGRRAVLDDIRGLLAPRGLLVFSSHNLWTWEHPDAREASAASRLRSRARLVRDRPLGWVVRAIVRLPRRRANRRRLAPLQRRAADHAIVNDPAHDYGLLHYYIDQRGQRRQLAELGYEMVEVVDVDGTPVPPGADGRGSTLYYVASPVA
ncbi:MAG: class I SAM-dependent methyltransferase, partial [Solirubrobacteraceae bacterium]